ncbi:MAG: hypothetical protein L3J82_09900 [Planctomycetes bacterium]|nr:hypothetical protein [Planctomycetota bacterium]
MDAHSLYRAACESSREYRLAVTARLGDGYTEAALAEWNQQRFWLWALDRVMEHVEGKRNWIECGQVNFSRVGQSPELTSVTAKIRVLKSRLIDEALPSFREKEEIIEQLSDLANQLLD